MQRIGTKLRRIVGPALLAAAELVVAFALLAATAPPAAAQFDFRFPFFDTRPRRPSQPSWPWGQPERREAPVDFSKAPPPRKHDTPPTTNIVVLGDSMADWLGYGLEEAFAEAPEFGITRKHRANRGLIKIETRSEAYDAVQAARDILAAEKPDVVVMMIGLADRQSIRERQVRAAPATPGQPPQTQQPPAAAPPVDSESSGEEQPAIVAPEPAPSGSGVTHQFRSEKWADIYAKRIDDTIAVLKSKGAPVFWVGLPAIRGTRSTADMVYLNDLYRSRAEKAGIVYVDVWDGFVDETGNFSAQGPDFEGQIRRLRAGDGVHFTKAGARKLAHYVEREIRRVMLARGAPLAMPAPEEPQTPAAGARPNAGGPAPRPVAGPVVPLTSQPTGSESLLGTGPVRPPGSDPLVNRVLVKGEAVPAPAGRADDFAWPRRDGMPNAAVSPAGTAVEPASAPAASPTPAKPGAAAPPASATPATKPPATAATPSVKKPRPPLNTVPPGVATRDDFPRPPGSVPNATGSWPFRR